MKNGRQVQIFALILAGTLGLSGCEDGQTFQDMMKKKPAQAGAAVQQTSTKLVERDVEAPEVFQVTDKGLWDGRPSLGGVWVAHSDVNDPERVIIRNEANGKFVIGALFKREATAPGPGIQVSSDAAEALGLLAGAPAKLNVTALRREEIAPPEPAQVETLESPEDIQAMSLDPIEGAAAALDAVEANPVSPPSATAPKPAPQKAATAAASSLSKPYIQIGIFSVEANAKRTMQMLQSQGLKASVKTGSSNGKKFWRVVVGPAKTSTERKSLLDKVKKAGFTDAYSVTH